jgi:hypothetical protein
MIGNWQYATPHCLFGLLRRTLNNGTLVFVTGKIEDDLEYYITMCRFGQHCRYSSCMLWDEAGQTIPNSLASESNSCDQRACSATPLHSGELFSHILLVKKAKLRLKRLMVNEGAIMAVPTRFCCLRAARMARHANLWPRRRMQNSGGPSPSSWQAKSRPNRVPLHS